MFPGKFAVDVKRGLRRVPFKVERYAAQVLVIVIALLFPFGDEYGAYGAQVPKNHVSPAGVSYRNAPPGVAYVGSGKCATCHESIYESFRKTSMGRSMVLADSPAELARASSPVTIFDQKSNLYFEVYRQDSSLYQTAYKIDSNGRQLFRHTEKLAFVIGRGLVGYTYLVQRGQYFFEAPLSFYSKRESWGLSPGFEFQDPGLNRPIVSLCVSCHSGRPLPASTRSSPGVLFEPFKSANPPFAELAIGCENCHGPGQLHVEERLKAVPLAGNIDSATVNPAKLSPWLANNICMNCHQMGDARVVRPGHGPFDFRPGSPLDETVAILQKPLNPASPLRSPLLGHYLGMILSKCYMESGGRMSCITCHDPHVEPASGEIPVYFRVKCLICHSDASCKLPISQRFENRPPDDCAGCHMHKSAVEIVPHTALTDHRIVAFDGEPYPDAAYHLTTPSLPDLVHLDALPGKVDQPLLPEALVAAYAQVLNKDPTYRNRYLAVLAEAARAEPDNLFVLSELAQYAMWEGTEDSRAKATQYLERAVQSQSDNPEDYLRLAELLAHADRLAESVETLKRGIPLSPYTRQFYELLVADYLSLKQPQQATQAAQQGLELFPEDAAIPALLKTAGLSAVSP